MNRTVWIACFVIVLFGFHGEARAFTFALDSYDVSLHDTDPGLVLQWAPILERPYFFDLDLGESIEVLLFEIGTGEAYVNLDDMLWKEILVSFMFTNPVAWGQAEGRTRGRWLSQDGVVRWNGPAMFGFDGTGMLTASLLDTRFDLKGTAGVWASFENVREGETGTAPVPEPATALLLGSSLLGVGWALRRKH